MDKETKIIRMTTGEDIICTIDESDDGKLTIHNPMHVICRGVPTGQRVMMMMPWLPYELVETNSVMIYADDIITIMRPRKEIIEYYENMILDMNEAQKENAEKRMFNDLEEDDNSFFIEEELSVMNTERSNTKTTIH